MHLAEFFQSATPAISRAEFSRRIGVSAQSMHRYLRFNRCPSPKIMEKIIFETNGQVLPNDFFKEQIEKTNRKKSKKEQ
jgi:hypothetical protein